MRKEHPDSAKECVTVRNDGEGIAQGEERKSLRIADLCEGVREDAVENGSASCRARTYDPLIKSPLLCR
jgi:hypothetical protein